MQKKFSQNTTWVTALFLLLVTSSVRAQSFSDVVVFGDSLSDNGNLVSTIGQLPPPFFEGARFSNGPVAVETLTEFLGGTLTASRYLVGEAAGTNYAVAQAQVVRQTALDFDAQVAAFLAANSGAAPADNLYVLFAGGNDVRVARDMKLRAGAKMLSKATSKIARTMQLLVRAGARSIMVVNVPNLGLIPETIALSKQPGKRNLRRKAMLLSQFFNRSLERKITKMGHRIGVSAVVFDLFEFLATMNKTPRLFGFTNTKEGCFDRSTFQFNDACNGGANFDQFSYFDDIHPTAPVHERIGRAMFALVPISTGTDSNNGSGDDNESDNDSNDADNEAGDDSSNDETGETPDNP